MWSMTTKLYAILFNGFWRAKATAFGALNLQNLSSAAMTPARWLA
jgi:hypothetical protein